MFHDTRPQADKKRVVFSISVIVFIFITMAIRLFNISIEHYNQYPINTETNPIRRATIVDCNDITIATNLVTASLYAKPHMINKKHEEIAKNLVKVLPDMQYENVLKKLKSTKRFIWLKRHITPKQQNSINNLGIPVLQFVKDYKRVYPQSELFAHIVGMVDTDGKATAGIEKFIDKHSIIEKLPLSIDIRVQSILHTELKKQVELYNALGGAGIIAEASTGKIIAMVSLPDFDPNHPATADNNAYFNRATLGVYEMGSTVKVFSMAAALEADATDMNEVFDVSKPIHISKYTVKDFYKSDKLTTSQIFIKSSNIGMVKIILRLGTDLLSEFLDKIGLTAPLQIEIPEKSAPINSKHWSESNLITISYGYGIATTLLHIVQATAPIVNGGTLYPMTLTSLNPNKGTQVLSKETSDKMRYLMNLTVQKGTGRKAQIKGYDVGGKTGSAEKVIDGKYDKSLNISSFIGAFPMEEPKYIIATMIDEPKKLTKGLITGGTVAAPIAAEVIKRIALILNIKPKHINT